MDNEKVQVKTGSELKEEVMNYPIFIGTLNKEKFDLIVKVLAANEETKGIEIMPLEENLVAQIGRAMHNAFALSTKTLKDAEMESAIYKQRQQLSAFVGRVLPFFLVEEQDKVNYDDSEYWPFTSNEFRDICFAKLKLKYSNKETDEMIKLLQFHKFIICVDEDEKQHKRVYQWTITETDRLGFLSDSMDVLIKKREKLEGDIMMLKVEQDQLLKKIGYEEVSNSEQSSIEDEDGCCEPAQATDHLNDR